MNNHPSEEEFNQLSALYDSQNFLEVKNYCEKLLAHYPTSVTLYNILGVAFQNINEPNKAIESYMSALALYPEFTEAEYNLATVLYQINDTKRAVQHYKKILKAKPNHFLALNNLGIIYYDNKNYIKAKKYFTRSIQFKIDFSEAYNNLGLVFHKQNNFKIAIQKYDKAIELNQIYKEAYNNRGAAFQELGKLAEAIKDYKTAIKINDCYADAYCKLGAANYELGNFSESIDYLNKAIKLDPNLDEAHWNLALSLLIKGNFKSGWKKYKHGFNAGKRRESRPNIPMIDNHSIMGKSILVTAEQGIGDEVMFLSCLSDLQRDCPKEVTVETDKRLHNLINNSYKNINVIDRAQDTKKQLFDHSIDIDYQISMGDLPSLYRNIESDFSKQQSYLSVENELLKKWKNRYKKLGDKPKVGISWKGGHNSKQQNIRSIDLQDLAGILSTDVDFINLQYGDIQNELNAFHENTGILIHHWNDSNPLMNLDNFFAQLNALDLVISIDNSTVHFSGSLGVPTWVILPKVPDFRWLLNTKHSLWYPSLSLYRNKKISDWENVLSTIKIDLEQLIKK